MAKSAITPFLGPFAKWGTRIGQVEDILWTPCATTPSMWVKAAFNALPTLLLTPIKPSAVDFLIIRVGFGGHGLKRRKFFDVWDFEQLERVSAPGVQWVKFLGGPLLARALWYIAVADAVTAFSVNWVSGVYQMAGCEFPGEAYIHEVNSGPLRFGTGSGSGSLGWWDVVDRHNMNGGGTDIIGPPNNETYAFFQVSTGPDPLTPDKIGEATFSLVNGNTNEVLATGKNTPDDNGNSNVTLVGSAGSNISPSQSFRVDWSKSGDPIMFSSGTFDGYGRSARFNLKPDP